MILQNNAAVAYIGLIFALYKTCLCYQKDGQCYKSLNLVIALDASSSINMESWQSEINLSKQIIQSLSVAGSGNKFGIIEFSNSANVTHPLNSNYAEATNSLESIRMQVNGGHTYIDSALYEAIKMFESSASSLDDTQNLLITVSDGYMTYRNGEDIFDILKAPIDKLKALKVGMFAVSIGKLVKEKTLKFVTTNPAYFFKTDEAAKAVEVIKKLTEMECPKIACSTVEVWRAGSGCYKDDAAKLRPLPDLIFTDRDTSSRLYSGTTTDWKNWDTYLKGLVCRCAEAVAKQGRKIFGLQYYGECWSSPVNNTYSKDGVATEEGCVSLGFVSCNETTPYCVGKQFHNFVYNIVSSVVTNSPELFSVA